MKAVESVFLFFFFVGFGACIEEDLSMIDDSTSFTKEFPLVQSDLWPHFRTFEREASERGFDVDLNNTLITGVIENIDDRNIAGTCSYGGRSNFRDIAIDASFWEQSSYLGREYIVFHELGHCFLSRDHEELCLANNTYASIMRSGHGTCRDDYRRDTRDYYVDELFGIMTP